MIFDLRKTSDYSYRKQIEITTLGQLMEFCRKNGTIIIEPEVVGIGKEVDKPPKIEIYDDWRE